MPKIQIMARAKDGPGDRQRGDIVSVKSVPNKGWGKGEDLPDYLIIEIDTDRKGFEDYEGRHLQIMDGERVVGTKRSKYRLDLDVLPKVYAKKRPHLTLSKNDVTSNAILKAFV